MPELPEVEITARRLGEALKGAEVESALAPGMVVLKSVDVPLGALEGRRIEGVRRIGKMPGVEFGSGGDELGPLALRVPGAGLAAAGGGTGPPAPAKVPVPLKVPRREGEPCPRCGVTLAAVHFAEHTTTYCPAEQTGGRVLKDRRLSKLLK